MDDFGSKLHLLHTASERMHLARLQNHWSVGTHRWNNDDATLIQRLHVESTLYRPCLNGVCFLGGCRRIYQCIAKTLIRLCNFVGWSWTLLFAYSKYSKIWTLYFTLVFAYMLLFYELFLVLLSGMANSVDSDQTAPPVAVWFRSTLLFDPFCQEFWCTKF